MRLESVAIHGLIQKHQGAVIRSARKPAMKISVLKSVEIFQLYNKKSVKVWQLLITILLFLMRVLFFLIEKRH
jgi:hypothetical protein